MLDSIMMALGKSGWVLFALIAYLVGSVPFGVVFARLFNLGDLREVGSGNIGATNVLRTGNKLAAFLTLLCDSGKGAAMVLIGSTSSMNLGLLMGAAAFIGHLYPIFLRLKGGKGVATFLGTILAAQFWIGLAACGMWLVVAALGRISSLAAIVTVSLLPLLAFLLGYPPLALTAMVMGLLVLWKHRANIARIIDGTEPRIGKS